jgi:GT2 family glycosyltransferase
MLQLAKTDSLTSERLNQPEGCAKSDPALTIIIPSYNTRNLLEGCLTSVYAHPPRHSYEVLVIDDASSDGSVELVRERFPQVCLLVNERNLGYARSNNKAIARTSGRFIYLLNSDAEVLEGAMDALVDFLEAHPEVGAAGSLLYNEDGTLQASVKAVPSIQSGLFGKRSILAKWFPHSRFTRSELLQWKVEDNRPFQAGYISSASLMLRRDVVERVGELDARFWYFIDADYCKRVRDLGLEVYCVPQARAIHKEHRGGTRGSWKRRFMAVWTFHYGAYTYFRKHSGWPWWHPLHGVVVIGLSGRFVASLVFQVLRELTGYDRRKYGERSN